MMAAEAGAEEGGSVTSAGMVRAVGGAESEHYPTLCRGKELGPQGSFLVGSGGDTPGAGGPALCSALGFLSLGSGPAPLVSGGGGAVTTTGQGQEMSGGLLPPPEPSTVAFPPPPQPPSLAGGLGTVDEGDSLDGPEYEEEEVAIPLNAPPTNHRKPCTPSSGQQMWDAASTTASGGREGLRGPSLGQEVLRIAAITEEKKLLSKLSNLY
ncbi:ras GTPase-activating protein 1-like isoform X1 [Rissa tridactyla]|uniref:ras GTPase-activating protein 1-like isoform X1 n=1 Tax=Rissa tridactyla TaxID=75485 RepID=UPI0023BA777D|nr:ras GTPase-activating protein 1-like isoform X1 [Rissa tridactyla]XP_054040404.1 ras GTPase-activating protein 1-like isoform X1 [Rissa tridactyla]